MFWVCGCKLCYLACEAHTPYCYQWRIWLCHISHKQHDFQKKRILNIKCAFDFLFNIFLKYKCESNENLKYVYLIIYWTQKVHNDFIFLCSIVLPPVGHSSNHQYHCCQLTRQSSCGSNFYRTFKVFIWLSLVFLILRRTEWDIVINVHRSSYKAPIICIRFQWKLNFLNRFLKNTQTWNSMKVHSVGAR